MSNAGPHEQPRCPHGQESTACPECMASTSRPATAASYADKYRGTEWGASVQPVHASTTRRRGGRSPLTFAVIGLVVVLAVVGVAIVGLKKPPSGGSATAAASAPIAVAHGAGTSPARSAQPSPSGRRAKPAPSTARPATPTTKPTAKPTTRPAAATAPPARPGSDAGTAVRAAFARRVADPDLTLHLTFDATISVATESFDMSGTMDVAGDDMSGRFDFRSDARNLSMDMVIKDERAYGRLAGEDWERIELPDRDTSGNPFGGADGVDTVEYVGAERQGGRVVHRLRMAALDHVNPALFESDSLKGMRVDGATFDVFVTADGTPVYGLFGIAGRVPARGGDAKFEIEMTYRFSKVGEDIVITAPRVRDGDSDPAPAAG